MRRHAILLIEGRGQAIHFKEDANLNLLQAAFIARALLESGHDVRLRIILDPGQSIEEYSFLCHAADATMDRYRSMERHEMVRTVRAQLPVTIEGMPLGGMAIEDRVFFAAMAARITGVNEEVMASLRRLEHPLVDHGRIDEYEALLRAYTGEPYLDLEERVARDVLRDFIGQELDFRIVSRREGCPTTWLRDPVASGIIDRDLAEKERGGAADFQDRLIGLFTTVHDPNEERPYFNSPICVRREHGKVRIIARDRFSLLGLKASERMSFERFRELIAAQSRDAGERPIMLKYPYTARYIAAGIHREVDELAASGPVSVYFVDGLAGALNPSTGGLIDAELRQTLPGRAAYHRVFGREGYRNELPHQAGGLPLIAARLWAKIEETFSDHAWSAAPATTR